MTVASTIVPLPGIRFVPVRRLPYAERVRLLKSLAKDCQWLDPQMVTIVRDGLAHDSLAGPQVDEWWTLILERTEIARGAELGIIDWDWSCDSCGHAFGRSCECSCCPPLIDHAWAVADDAIAVLAGGIR
jgi:hypothetical protein